MAPVVYTRPRSTQALFVHRNPGAAQAPAVFSHVQVQKRPCGEDTSRCSPGPYGVDILDQHTLLLSRHFQVKLRLLFY